MSTNLQRNKKVLFVSRCSWTLYNFRRNLICCAQETGWDVLCAGMDLDDYGSQLRRLGLKYEPIPLSGRSLNPFSDIRTFIALLRLMRRERPDIVHNFTIKPVIYGSLAARLAKVPRIFNTITGLGHSFSSDGSRFIRKIVEKLYGISILNSDHIFFQNENDVNRFKEFEWFSSISYSVVSGSGVDLEEFRPVRTIENRSTLNKTFVMVTRLLREKGVFEFCQAARLVRKRYPDAKFRIVGGPDLASPSGITLDDLKDFTATGDVELCGAVDNVADYLAASDVCVLPSYYREGIPRALLEAAAMGKPIITTDWPGCREAVVPGQSGILVSPRSAASLSEAMIDFIEHPSKIAEMGNAGRSYVEERFDERRVIDSTLEIYRETARKG